MPDSRLSRYSIGALQNPTDEDLLAFVERKIQWLDNQGEQDPFASPIASIISINRALFPDLSDEDRLNKRVDLAQALKMLETLDDTLSSEIFCSCSPKQAANILSNQLLAWHRHSPLTTGNTETFITLINERLLELGFDLNCNGTEEEWGVAVSCALRENTASLDELFEANTYTSAALTFKHYGFQADIAVSLSPELDPILNQFHQASNALRQFIDDPEVVHTTLMAMASSTQAILNKGELPDELNYWDHLLTSMIRVGWSELPVELATTKPEKPDHSLASRQSDWFTYYYSTPSFDDSHQTTSLAHSIHKTLYPNDSSKTLSTREKQTLSNTMDKIIERAQERFDTARQVKGSSSTTPHVISALADAVTEWANLNPFKQGNTATLITLLDEAIVQTGHVIDITKIDESHQLIDTLTKESSINRKALLEQTLSDATWPLAAAAFEYSRTQEQALSLAPELQPVYDSMAAFKASIDSHISPKNQAFKDNIIKQMKQAVSDALMSGHRIENINDLPKIKKVNTLFDSVFEQEANKANRPRTRH